MAFLHPEFLWGLLTMIIPILIHLFDFRKNRKVYFPDIRFLKQVKHSSRKPLKLKQLLILISRLTFLFFLIMVFAQPIIPTNSKKQLKGGVKLLYLDNSQSMSSLVNPKESAIERAKLIGENIINQLPNGQEIIIVNNDNINQFLTPNTLTEASEKISAINLSDKPSSLNQLGIALNEYTKRNSDLSDIFIISDFQKSTSELELSRLDTTLTYWLSPIIVEATNNCVVDSVYLVDSNINADGNIKIDVVVANNGSQLKENLPIKVFVGNRQVSAATITIPAYQRKSISFSLGKINVAKSGYIQIEDYPNTFDNVFYFSIPQKRNLNIFEITGENSSNFIETVFGNKTLFSIFSNNFQNVENSLFEKADFLVLNQIQNPGVELLQQLQVFAENGGNILVIPGLDFNLNTYINLSSSLIKSAGVQKQKLKSPSSKTPFFSSILEKSTRAFEMPSITPVWSWGQDRSALLSFEDGSPYLSEITNNIYFVSAPFIESVSNFQSHALFVPVMYGLASQSISPAGQLFSRIESDYYDIKIDSIEFRDLVKLSKDEIEIVPGKTKVGNKWRLAFPKEITNTGTYNVAFEGIIKGSLSINLNKEESQLAPLNTAEISSLFSGYKINFLETYNSNSTILSSFDTGMALWKYALTICLLFLLIETLLIRFL